MLISEPGGAYARWQGICYTEIEVIVITESNLKIFMRRSDLGEFEEVVLLAVAVLTPEAYSVVVAEELEQQTGKTVTTGAVHAALQRLENKGLVTSRMGEATSERGGRRKRIFTVTASGSRVLHEARNVRNNLWSRIAPHSLPKVRTA
jgi:PadR family transcriptional regulator PadR